MAKVQWNKLVVGDNAKFRSACETGFDYHSELIELAQNPEFGKKGVAARLKADDELLKNLGFQEAIAKKCLIAAGLKALYPRVDCLTFGQGMALAKLVRATDNGARYEAAVPDASEVIKNFVNRFRPHKEGGEFGIDETKALKIDAAKEEVEKLYKRANPPKTIANPELVKQDDTQKTVEAARKLPGGIKAIVEGALKNDRLVFNSLADATIQRWLTVATGPELEKVHKQISDRIALLAIEAAEAARKASETAPPTEAKAEVKEETTVTA